MNITPLTTHPGWCSPQVCESTPGDVCHRSNPTTLTHSDATWEFQACVTDEHGLSGQPELLVTLTGTTLTDQGGRGYLTLVEIQQLIATLTEQYWRMRLLGTPIVRRTQGRVA